MRPAAPHAHLRALAVCTIGTPTTETVSQPFVPLPVTAGDCLWVSLEIVADADVCTSAEMTGTPVAVGVTGQTLTFDGGAGPVVVVIPPGVVIFSPSNGTVPMTSFDGSSWQTMAAACGGTEVGAPCLWLPTHHLALPSFGS